jgi:hypothetical protein
MPIEYSTTVPFAGSGKRALAVAQTTLVSLNFRIVSSSETELRVSGRGINSTRENPLKTVTEATFLVRNAAIEIAAKLGGVEKLRRFLRIFPIALATFFLLVWTTIAYFLPDFRHWWIFVIPLAPLSPWIFLTPIISRSFERRSRDAMDSLVGNMVLLGSAD